MKRQWRPALDLSPGVRLHAEVGVALRELNQLSDGDGDAMGKVNATLRGVLAYTAAVGETCQVMPAVEAVRAAGQCLETGQLSEACVALTDALGHLSVPIRPAAPAQRAEPKPLATST
jgi:hypothetical protein